MWAHRPWLGRFLPSSAPGHELEAYSRLLNAVEGNTTFYASPQPTIVARWVSQTNPGFRFVFKVPREITHVQRLRDIDRHLNAFLTLMEPLIERTGAVAFQLPPSFAPVDLPVLEAVLANVSTAWRWAVEVRHPAFFDGPDRVALDAVLARHGTERVLLDSRTLFARPPRTEAGRDAWAQKPRLPTLAEPITDRPIVRFIGSDHPDLTEAGLQQWHEVVAGWLHEGRSPTVFVHTPDNDDVPALARGFHAAVALIAPGLSLLDDPLPVDDAEQGSLFDVDD
jgi:uncharacterized protein YecE (DUF72 family)